MADEKREQGAARPGSATPPHNEDSDAAQGGAVAGGQPHQRAPQPATPDWVARDPFGDEPYVAAPRTEDPAGKRGSTTVVVDGSLGGSADRRPGGSAPRAAETRERPSPRDAERARSIAEPPGSQSTADGSRGRGGRLLGLPTWRWILLLLVTTTVILTLLHVRNRNRYRLVCHGQHVELQRGRRLMWPVGFETMGGPFRRVGIPAEADCQDQRFYSRTEAESAFLQIILSNARRALASPGADDLKRLREQMGQALVITRASSHRSQRRQVERLLADIAYRQAREALGRVENELRTALGHLQEAQRRAADRYEDLEDWIAHFEGMLRSVSPSPGSTPLLRPSTSLRPPTGPANSNTAPLPPRAEDVAPPPDAGPGSSSDAEIRGGGILM